MPDDTVLIENYCSRTAINPAYHALIAAVVEAYRTVFGDQVEEVRLMGSVARGEAMPGLSDIDFLALVHEEPSATARAELGRHAAALGRIFPIASLVDLEACRLDDLHPTQRFILSSDSLAVAGTDRLTLVRQTLRRDTLIPLVTPPMAQLLSDYGEAVARLATEDSDQLRFYSRVIGKDLLKGLRGSALRRGAAYERNIAAIAEQALVYFPEHSATIAKLYHCYRSPTADRAALLGVLAVAARLPA